jgi:hypothetical protein
MPVCGRFIWALTLTFLANDAAASRRIRVEHLAPYVGRHQGGQLINVTGKGVRNN